MDKNQSLTYEKAAMDDSSAAAVALINLDARLRACIAFGLSAEEAYDSHYQGETKAAIDAVAGPIDAAVSSERERMAAKLAQAEYLISAWERDAAASDYYRDIADFRA